MRLLRVEVRDFRGLDEVTLDLEPTGVTVVEGPNEAGKTSLAEAVEMLFERHDSSVAAEVREAQPLGRDVGPEVVVEGEAGELRFRYRKRFLRRPETELEVLAPRPESRTGREAHDRILELLDEAGVDRDLWKALRLVQGEGMDRVEGLATSTSLLDALGAAAAQEDAAGDGRHPVDLHQRARREAERYWTAKRSDPTGELREAREELEAARGAEGELARRMEALEADAERSGELERRRVELRATRERAAAALGDAEAEVGRIEGLESEERERRSRLGEEETTLDLLRELAEAGRVEGDLTDRLAAARALAETAAAAHAPAVEAREAARVAADAAEARLERRRHRARLAERLVERRATLAELTERTARVREAEERRTAAAERLAALPAVDDEALAELDHLQRREQRLEAGLEAAAPRLELTARTDLDLRLVGGGAATGPDSGAGTGGEGDGSPAHDAEAPGGVARDAVRGTGGEVGGTGPGSGGRLGLASGEVWRRRVAAPLRLELPGVLALSVAPGGDAAALGSDLAAVHRSLVERCRALGVDGPQEAARVHRQRRAAAAEAESAGAVVTSLLGGRRGGADGTVDAAAAVADLERRRAEAEAEIVRLEGELAPPRDGGPATPEPGDGGQGNDGEPSDAAVEASVEAARIELARARELQRRADASAEARRGELESARGTVRELEVERRNAGERRRRAADRAAGLLRRRGGADRLAAPGVQRLPDDDAGNGGAAGPAAGSSPVGTAVEGEPGTARPDGGADPLPRPGVDPGPGPDPGQLALFAAVGAARRAGAGGGGGPDRADVTPPAPPTPSLEFLLDEAQVRTARAREALADARRRLAAAEPDRVRRRVATAREARAAAEAELRAVDDEHLAARTRLDAAGEQGLFEALAEARGRRAAAERAAAAVEARAAAARRLLDALDGAREAARRTYSGPLARTLEELGRPLFGEDFRVELDEDLNVVRRTAFGATLEVSRLSAGAREQLALLTRLACAVLVSPSRGIPLIVDDALGHSDPERLAALGEVLTRVGERCQVLVLTCFPERYGQVRGARRVRLESPQGRAVTGSG